MRYVGTAQNGNNVKEFKEYKKMKELPDLNPKLIINKMIDAIASEGNKYAIKAKAHELIDHMKKNVPHKTTNFKIVDNHFKLRTDLAFLLAISHPSQDESVAYPAALEAVEDIIKIVGNEVY